MMLTGKIKFGKALKNKLINLRWLLIYIVINNLLWFIIMVFQTPKSISFLITPLFYLFNYLAVIMLFSLYNKYGSVVLKSTLYSVIIGNFLQVILSPFAGAVMMGGESMERGALFFNNPNQLGYHVLLTTSIFLVLLKYFKVKMYLFVPFLLCSLYMASLSVSKAAVLSIVLLFGIYFLTNFDVRRLWLIPTMIAILVGFYFSDFGQQFMDKFQTRMTQAENLPVSEWEYRGYDRMEKHPYYMILGSGEGVYERFDSYIGKHEMHSSYGTLIFAYGIPGLLLFIFFIADILKGIKFGTIAYILPILSYGFSHQGLRFTMLWVAFAIFALVGNETYLKKIARRKQRLEANVPMNGMLKE